MKTNDIHTHTNTKTCAAQWKQRAAGRNVCYVSIYVCVRALKQQKRTKKYSRNEVACSLFVERDNSMHAHETDAKQSKRRWRKYSFVVDALNIFACGTVMRLMRWLNRPFFRALSKKTESKILLNANKNMLCLHFFHMKCAWISMWIFIRLKL